MTTTGQAARAERFRALHRCEAPLLMPNPWDRGSAVLLASLGFAALATTSGAFALAALGALVEAACELMVDGTTGYWQRAKIGGQGARAAFPARQPNAGPA